MQVFFCSIAIIARSEFSLSYISVNNNPYEISKTAYWNEIKDLPHFCVARTLVNGLVDVMQDSIGGLICPLDDLVKHKYVYPF